MLVTPASRTKLKSARGVYPRRRSAQRVGRRGSSQPSTVPKDNGVCRENADAYISALNKSYESSGAFFNEQVDTKGMGLTPAAAGAMTQLRAFATCYQEIVEKTMLGVEFPEVLDSLVT